MYQIYRQHRDHPSQHHPRNQPILSHHLQIAAILDQNHDRDTFWQLRKYIKMKKHLFKLLALISTSIICLYEPNIWSSSNTSLNTCLKLRRYGRNWETRKNKKKQKNYLLRLREYSYSSSGLLKNIIIRRKREWAVCLSLWMLNG